MKYNTEIEHDVVKAVCEAVTVNTGSMIDSVKLPVNTPNDDLEPDVPQDLIGAYSLSNKDWTKGQQQDTVISKIISHIKDGSKPTKSTEHQLFDVNYYLRDWQKLTLQQGVLYRKYSVSGEDRLQLVLPKCLRSEIFQALHSDLGHQGRDRTTSLFKERFYWPGMDADISNMVRNCDRCIRRRLVQHSPTWYQYYQRIPWKYSALTIYPWNDQREAMKMCW